MLIVTKIEKKFPMTTTPTLTVHHRLRITNIDFRTEMDAEESAANWTQCVTF